METSWVWLKATDKDGAVTFTEHRCWNPELFAHRQNERAAEQGGTVEAITRAEYTKARFPKGAKR